MNTKSRRLLSALLAAVMFFCTAPICGSAEEETAPITEVVALREENVKHFDLSGRNCILQTMMKNGQGIQRIPLQITRSHRKLTEMLRCLQ